VKTSMVAAWLLSGCAAVCNSVYNYEEGWSEAVVESLTPDAHQLAQASLDCRASAPEGRYAYVRYEVALRPRHAVVVVPEGLTLQPGQRLYINTRDCRRPIAPVASPNREE